MSNACPYTGSLDLSVASEATRNRPESYTIMKSPTGEFCARHVSGRVYPLEDRTDPDSDIVLRVVG